MMCAPASTAARATSDENVSAETTKPSLDAMHLQEHTGHVSDESASPRSVVHRRRRHDHKEHAYAGMLRTCGLFE
jgi:hypothetical protein